MSVRLQRSGAPRRPNNGGPPPPRLQRTAVNKASGAVPRAVLQQDNWPDRVTSDESFRVEQLNKEFKNLPTWQRQAAYLDQLKKQKDAPFRRTYFPRRTNPEIKPSSGPGTRFWETSYDMKFREKLEQEQRSEKALAQSRELEKEETKRLRNSVSAPGLVESAHVSIQGDEVASSIEGYSTQGHLARKGMEGTGTLGPGGPPGWGGMTKPMMKSNTGAYVVRYRPNDWFANSRYDDQYRVKRHVARYGSQLAICGGIPPWQCTPPPSDNGE